MFNKHSYIECLYTLTQNGGSDGKESACNAGEIWVRSLSQEDPLDKEMAIHSSIPAWRIPWTEGPGGLQVHRVTESGTQLSD